MAKDNEEQSPVGAIIASCLMVFGTTLVTVGGALLWSWPAAFVILGVIALVIGFYLAFMI